MDQVLAALADPARWRLVSLLAERPRSVGVLAQLAQARQPQTTKHLQTLERAGIVTSQRVGQRRVYALQSAALRELAAVLGRLADTADQAGNGTRATYDRQGLALDAERLAAQEAGWADGRSFSFHRSLPGSPERVWRHLTETALLARWWTPDDLRVCELVFEARPGEHLAYRLLPLLPDGRPAFTAHVRMDLRTTGTGTGTDLDVHWRITDSTVGSADFVAGIETGFGQSLDKLAAVLREHAHDTDSTDSIDTRSTR
ncbi:metalloregulator ArsR/SmtB family transcription factor [Streptomyces cinerochromogenes]|uniref:metalloregulator ArsR/SmtB family transcription factor n=1 Tax=Streptomyces cinerochromogenes TaxID=66422 RepID=UPI003683D65E